MLYRKFGQCAYYKYHEKTVLVTHAGLSFIPENMTKLATEQMIRGVGRCSDYVDVAQTFDRMAAPNTYQVFGHRNTRNLPIELSERCFNLEGAVEFGGDLRVVVLDQDGFHPVYVKNRVFKTGEETEVAAYTEQELDVMELVDQMRKNKYITEKKYGNISSFNFTREAFYDKKWNKQTTKARGLFINTENGRIVASADEVTDKTELNASGLKVLPGLVDIHSHGAVRHDFSDADVDGLRTILQYEKSHGITSYCPTSMTLPKEELLKIFQTAKDVEQDETCARIVGINMEGPFLDLSLIHISEPTRP